VGRPRGWRRAREKGHGSGSEVSSARTEALKPALMLHSSVFVQRGVVQRKVRPNAMSNVACCGITGNASVYQSVLLQTTSGVMPPTQSAVKKRKGKLGKVYCGSLRTCPVAWQRCGNTVDRTSVERRGNGTNGIQTANRTITQPGRHGTQTAMNNTKRTATRNQ